MMKTLVRILLPVLLLTGAAACSQKDETTDSASSSQAQEQVEREGEAVVQAQSQEYVETCRAATQKLGGALKSALQAAMKDGGPGQALNVCHDEAEFIAQQICDEEGLTVGRTSRKFRNPGNEPDSWELAGLEAFDAKIAAGKQPEDLEMWATFVGAGGIRTFRYLKAIPTSPLCLKCHGADLAPELSAQLVELYPDDQALGFAVGDLRGAFTVTLDMPR